MAQTFGPVAEEQGLEFSVELDEGCPTTIVTDAHRLRQVLNNLLANAFKFTEHGRSRCLRAQHRRLGRDHERLAHAGAVIALSVADTGIGIEKALQPAMFEAFAQADGTTARKYGGTGLGLSISRDLVELLGGEITLDSEPGHGSTFTVYLPLESQDAAVVASRRVIVAAAPGRHRSWAAAITQRRTPNRIASGRGRRELARASKAATATEPPHAD